MTVLRAFLLAVSFLTRIPVPGRGLQFPARVAGLSVVFFPVVGLLLGLASAGGAWLIVNRFRLAPHPAWALLLVTLQAFLTGAFHLDGLADVVDGLGGSRGNRDRALEIMKDGRIGAFGAVALILVLMGKVLSLWEVLRMPGHLAALVCYPIAARAGAVALVVFFPCARPGGLARTFHDESRWLSAVLAPAVSLVGIGALGPAVLLPAGVAFAVALAVGAWIWVRLGGLTGDAYGAAIELGELAFLGVAAFPGLRGG